MICILNGSSECDGCMQCMQLDSRLHCELCGGAIDGEYYDLDGIVICPDCMVDCRRGD